MTKTKYNLQLEGYVGGWDFDSDYVDFVLNKDTGTDVSSHQPRLLQLAASHAVRQPPKQRRPYPRQDVLLALEV